MVASRPVAEDTRDAGRLKQGTFAYHDLDHGKEVGAGSITIRRIPKSGDYSFSSDTTFTADFSGFHSQRWQAIARANFEPLSAALAFVGDAGSSPIFELHYAAQRVSGYVIASKASAPPEKRLVDDSILEYTVDQRIDWAAAISGTLRVGAQSEFSVYDANTGVSRVVERIGGPEAIKTPAGTFSAIRITYQVEKRGKLERYVVFATRQVRRMHSCINLRQATHGGLWAWEFEKNGRELNVRVDGQLIFNNIFQVRDAALNGSGLAYIPEDLARPYISKGQLLWVLQDWSPPWSGYHLYYPSRRQSSPAFALVVNALRHSGK